MGQAFTQAPQPVHLELAAGRPAQVCGTLLTGEAHAHNTFDAPDAVAERPLEAAVRDGGVDFVLPPCSLASVQLV